MTNRVIGANIYSRPLISRADMDILDKALSDWKVDNWYTTRVVNYYPLLSTRIYKINRNRLIKKTKFGR